MRTIITPDNINQLLAEQGLPIAAHINTLIVAIAEAAARDNYDDCTIKVHVSLLADSYAIVPALWGRSLHHLVEAYPAVHTFRRTNSDFITVYAGAEKRPVTFKQRIIQRISRRGCVVVKRAKVPPTYQHNPNLFAKMLTQAIGKHVGVMHHTDGIEWYVEG